jgi:hypothetical protein
MGPMTRSKVVRARAAAAEKRIGAYAVGTTLAAKGKKLDKAVETVARAADGTKPYLVMVDSQGVGYLRVEVTKTGARLLVNTGKKIETVEMDTKTLRSRNLQPCPEAGVMEAAKVLARPLTPGVIISERSKRYLDTILNDKELVEMANAKKSTKKSAKVAAAKSAAPKKAAGTKRANGLDEKFAVVEKVLMAHKGSMTRKEFRAALEGKFANRSTVKAELVAAGKIKEDAEHNISLK